MVLGQYTRVGESTRFGFGGYRIAELGPEPFAVDRSISLVGLAMRDHLDRRPRLHDRMPMTARLSKPGYAYIIALRPDGTVELCAPDSEAAPPPRTDTPRYPDALRTNPETRQEESHFQQSAIPPVRCSPTVRSRSERPLSGRFVSDYC